jgi:hypothetical protein
MTTTLWQAATALSVLLFGAFQGAAAAATISFTGNLKTDATFVDCGPGCQLIPANSDDTDYAQYAAVVRTFNVGTSSLMSALSFSYGGGVNGAGTSILGGGLQPYLSLFDSSGNFLASTFFGTTCPPGAVTNSTSGQCYDVLLNGGTLAPGTYRIALTAYSNLSFAENLGAGTLADGFTGLGNLAFGEDLHYAFDVILTSAGTSPVPEPGSLALVFGALLCGLIGRRNLNFRKGSTGQVHITG